MRRSADRSPAISWSLALHRREPAQGDLASKAILALSAIALAACANTAEAQCSFNAVAGGRGMKASLVRAYVGCPSTLAGPGHVNTSTGGGTPACSPVVPKPVEHETTGYVFDSQKGKCNLQTKARIEQDCALLKDAGGDPLGLPAGPCHVTDVKAKCQGILRADELTPISADADTGWSLATLMRWTFHDSTFGDMTMIDFPMTFAFKDPSNGKIALDSSSAEALATILYDINGAALPTCISGELLRVVIKDPNGLPFAALGTSTRTATE